MQKAFVIQYYSEKRNNLAELNQLLEGGWKVVSQGAMSGSDGGTVYSLVILEKN